jgi:endonuclease/exonuclease/phosphatase family metal-dependent hydrolase
MILATWNVATDADLEARLASFRGEFAPDAIALQEPSQAAASSCREWCGDGRSKKGVAFDTRLPYERVILDGTTSPCIAARIIDSPMGPFNVLAVWAKQLANSYFEDLRQTLDLHAAFITERPTVVMGDFNLDVRIQGKGRRDFDRMNRRMEDNFGCVSAYHAHTGEPFGVETAATHYHAYDAARPFHCDYVYVPTAWASRLRSVVVPGFDRYAKSDHRPVVVEVVPS